jgi:hypothetical protein
LKSQSHAGGHCSVRRVVLCLDMGRRLAPEGLTESSSSCRWPALSTIGEHKVDLKFSFSPPYAAKANRMPLRKVYNKVGQAHVVTLVNAFFNGLDSLPRPLNSGRTPLSSHRGHRYTYRCSSADARQNLFQICVLPRTVLYTERQDAATRDIWSTQLGYLHSGCSWVSHIGRPNAAQYHPGPRSGSRQASFRLPIPHRSGCQRRTFKHEFRHLQNCAVSSPLGWQIACSTKGLHTVVSVVR